MLHKKVAVEKGVGPSVPTLNGQAGEGCSFSLSFLNTGRTSRMETVESEKVQGAGEDSRKRMT